MGDLWALGDHRLLCGDALMPQRYELLMPGEQAAMVITDPPYNVKLQGHAGGKGKIKHKEFAMASSETSSTEFTAFLNVSLGHMAHYAQNGAIVFVFMDWRHLPELQQATLPLFGEPRQMCVWAKDNGVMGTFYRSQHEICYVFKNGDGPHINNFELGQHGRYRSNVWSYAGVNTFAGKGYQQQAMHPTVKPAAMIADAMRDCSHRQGIVLDASARSGTVLIAAERTGRHARAIEFEPQYVDVAINRWQAVTKKKAVLQATGQSWEEVRQLRLAANGQ